LASPAGAKAESAGEILKKVDAAGHTETTRMRVAQKVVTPGGDERMFKMISYARRGNEQSLTEYIHPKQVKGMKILTLNDGDDIWTHFPKTNRTRKIASSARNRRVQGSDFTYDDMATGKYAKQWQGTLLGQEKMAGKDCFKLSLKPTAKGPKSYTKTIAWIDRATYTPVRIDYYDLDGDLLKRLELSDYRKVSNVLVPFAYKMTNLQDGGKTLMKVADAEVNITLDPVLFTEAGLSK
jgi:outer membrane lipoprotein-sorting protein